MKSSEKLIDDGLIFLLLITFRIFIKINKENTPTLDKLSNLIRYYFFSIRKKILRI